MLPSQRIGDLQTCDNAPRFFNPYAIPAAQFGAANVEAGPAAITLAAKMFGSVSRDPIGPVHT